MAADLNQFQQLLNTLLSTDNDARTQAEVRITSTSLSAAQLRGIAGRRALSSADAGDLAPRARCRRVVRARMWVLRADTAACAISRAVTSARQGRGRPIGRRASAPTTTTTMRLAEGISARLTSARAIDRGDPKWCPARGSARVCVPSSVSSRACPSAGHAAGLSASRVTPCDVSTVAAVAAVAASASRVAIRHSQDRIALSRPHSASRFPADHPIHIHALYPSLSLSVFLHATRSLEQ